MLEALHQAGGFHPQETSSPGADPLDYLLAMPVHSLTQERFEALCERAAQLQRDLVELQQKSPPELWREDLHALRQCLLHEVPGYDDAGEGQGTSLAKVQQERKKAAAAQAQAAPQGSTVFKEARGAKKKKQGSSRGKKIEEEEKKKKKKKEAVSGRKKRARSSATQ